MLHHNKRKEAACAAENTDFSGDHPMVLGVAHLLGQLAPRDRAAVVSGLYALAAPYLVSSVQTAEKAVQDEDEPTTLDAPGVDHKPLTEKEQRILDLLTNAGFSEAGDPIPFTGPEIAVAVNSEYGYVKNLLMPSAPLRARGLIGHRANVGYFRIHSHVTSK